MKIGNIVNKPSLNITQSNHGALQANCAFDFGELEGIAPCDGEVTNIYQDGSDPHQKGFHFNVNGGYILFHHAIPDHAGHFNKGEHLWKTAWNHLHSAIYVNGSWMVLLDYMERDIDLLWFGGKKDPWTNWSTYTDRQLEPILPVNPTTMRAAGLFECVSNSGTWNIRALPDANAPIVTQLQPNTSWEATEIELFGPFTNGTTAWVNHRQGWINCSCLVSCQTKGGDAQCQVDLAAANAQISSLNGQVATLQGEVDSYYPNPTTYSKKA